MTLFMTVCVLVGCVGGLLQGMLSVGTGIVAIPLLTFLLPHYGIPQSMAIHIAIATSMGAITLCSIAATVSHHRNQNIRWDIFKKIVIFSIIGSGIGALIASHLPARILQIIFALLLFFIAAKNFKNKKYAIEADKETLSIRSLAVAGIFIGITASIIGIGGGLFMVPFLSAHQIQMRYAVGTATLVGLPVAMMGTLIYILTGLSHTAQIPLMLGYVNWPAFLAISAGGIVFAGVGAKLAKSLNPLLLQRLFSVCITLVGIKMLL